MGIGGGVDHNAVNLAIAFLNFVYNGTLVVGLELFYVQIFLLGGLLDQRQEILKGIFSIDSGLSNAQHIDIRAVDNKDLHSRSSQIFRICAAVQWASPLLSIW